MGVDPLNPDQVPSPENAGDMGGFRFQQGGDPSKIFKFFISNSKGGNTQTFFTTMGGDSDFKGFEEMFGNGGFSQFFNMGGMNMNGNKRDFFGGQGGDMGGMPFNMFFQQHNTKK